MRRLVDDVIGVRRKSATLRECELNWRVVIGGEGQVVPGQRIFHGDVDRTRCRAAYAIRHGECERVRAEIADMQANTRITELQAALLEKVVNELDLANITPSQAFVLVKALNPKGEKEVDLGMMEAEIDKMKAETEKIRAEKDGLIIQSDLDKAHSNKAKEKLKKF